MLKTKRVESKQNEWVGAKPGIVISLPLTLAKSQSYAASLHSDTFNWFGKFEHSRKKSVMIFRHKRMTERKYMKFPYLTTNRFSYSHSLSLNSHQAGQKEKLKSN